MAEKKSTLTPNPAAPEIFADRAPSVSLRGNVARITFASERAGDDAHNPAAVVSGHLAMSVRGFLQFYTQMQSVVKQMEDGGLIKPSGAAAGKPAAAKKSSSSRAKKPATKGRSGAKKS